MPLPKPTLDQRRFDQLVAEGRAMLPRLAPGWSDHNASDPGITLLELCAWMAEQAIYRFDRLSPQALRSFVRLVGIEPAQAGVATTVVSVDATDAAAGMGLALPPRVQLAGTDGGTTPGVALRPRFETTEALWVSPARLVQGRAGPAPGREIAVEAASFEPFGRRPRPGHALWLGFDRALDAPGQRLCLHAWTTGWADDDALRERLQREEADALAQAQRRAQASGGGWPSAPVPPWHQHYRVRTVWEYHAGGGRWQALAQVRDETRALSLSGFVRFAAPQGHQPGGAPGLAGDRWYLRCRIVRGRFECPPRLVQVAFNAVRAEHALSRALHAVGRGRGHAGAVFEAGEAPLVARSVTLRLDDGAGSVQSDWRCAPDWDRTGAHDPVLVLDAEHGRWHSGDGHRGRIPPAGHTLWAAYRVGGGPTGNLPAGSLQAVSREPANLALAPALAALSADPVVRQPLPALGGCAAETLAAAQGRAYEAAIAVDKAVTVGDIERLARATPGVPVARVRAIPGHHPAWPCIAAAGVTSVVVIPGCPRPAPMPSRAMLCAVERYLEPRRLVASELHAIAPRYRRIGVQATLHVACGSRVAGLVEAAQACLAALFDPLDGGPDGNGWPFGRTVYRADVMAALARLPGVDRVTGLGLLAGSQGDAASCDNVVLCPHELPRPGRHRLMVLADTAPILQRSLAHECPLD